MSGYIKLYRDIKEHWIFGNNRKLSKFEAWIDIIFRCNHRCKKVLIGNQMVLVKRGQFISSNVALGKDWGWDEKSVRLFNTLLQQELMIAVRSSTKFTLYEVLNYSEYQGVDTSSLEASAFRAKSEQIPSKIRADSEQIPTNKNVKNLKNEKNVKNIKDIVGYLNEKAGTTYKESTPKTKELINARFGEGFTVENFQKVIDKKVSQWKGNSMSKYLRPLTLFGTKFESYLNEEEGQVESDTQPKPKQNGKVNTLQTLIELAEGEENNG